MANHDSEVSHTEVMYPAATVNGEASQAMVPATPMALPGMPPAGGFLPRGPEILTSSFNQMWLINCLRRKWLPAILLGALAAVMAGGLLLLLIPISSSVTAQLELKANQERASYGKNKARALSARESEFFQASQLALFKSQFVLKAALTPRAISELEAVIKKGGSAVSWLTSGLRIGFRGDILQIQYDGEESSSDMVKIVNAVIQAYKDEVLAKERNISATQTAILRELRDQTKKELRENIDRHQKLAKELGGGETRLANTMLGMLRNDIHMINGQIRKAEEELLNLEINKTLAMQQARSPVAMEAAVEEALAQDPMMANFKGEKYNMAQQLRQVQATTRGGNSKKIKSLRQQYQQIEVEERRYRQVAEGDIRDKLKQAPNEGLSVLMAEYVMRKEGTTKKLVDLRALYTEKMEEILGKGEKSGAVALLESEIEQLREIVRDMDFQLRNEDVNELTALERIRVLQPALPKEKINSSERLMISILGGIAAFCVTCYGVALFEFRSRRLNGPVDVDEGLGIRVLGVLPSVSSRKAMAQGSPVAAQLSESIDNVRATLMHDSTSRSRQVVLVTSPASMEGCTTVSSHLALSLSRAGRRTLLIDGDLREPALHKLFGMPVEEGLSEMLRSEIEVSDAIRPTNTKGLWLLTAGHCDMEAIHALAADQLQPIFEKLRAEFDFIIIDGAPVLSLSDSLSIGQHVDGAILTVLRDHSSIPQIHKASELLKSMGIHLIGSVVNGVATKADRRVARLHGLEAQRQRQLAASEGAAAEKV
ncbi:MAG: polysaccharide biosynthesis tyrosine autokinase [Planctomycetes bacterium]|nr:polysaccharide biosynthesis tyrosine autokinase [Planctomycetota bacterium]